MFALGLLLAAAIGCRGLGDDDDQFIPAGTGAGGSPLASGNRRIVTATSSSAGSGAQSACSIAPGLYVGTFGTLSGDCGELQALSVPIADNTRIETSPSSAVETETVFNGCSVLFSRTTGDVATKTVSSRLHGTLTTHAALELSGTLAFARFDASGAMSCSGEYDARFSLSMLLAPGQ